MAVNTPGIPVFLHREGPRTSHPGTNRHFLAHLWKERDNTHSSFTISNRGYQGMPVSTKGFSGTPKCSRTLSEYITERRSNRSTTISGSLNTSICEPIILKCKISVSTTNRRQKTHKTYITMSGSKALVAHHIP